MHAMLIPIQSIIKSGLKCIALLLLYIPHTDYAETQLNSIIGTYIIITWGGVMQCSLGVSLLHVSLAVL